MFDRSQVSMAVEKTIITLLITSTEFCSQILPIASQHLFENAWAGVAFTWVNEHFHVYKEAPKEHIRDIYGVNYTKLPAEVAELISAMMEHLSATEDKNINLQFHINRSLTYFRHRSIIVLHEKMSDHLANGKYDAAEHLLTGHKEVSAQLVEWVKPSDFMSVLVKDIERKENPLFTFPGDLGAFIGPMQRSWLVLWMGILKSGKSWNLLATVIAALSQNLKVAVFSHEMSDVDWISRFMACVAPGAPTQGKYLYPVFDCALNATNACSETCRLGNGPDIIGGIINPHYRPCGTGKGCPKYDPIVTQNYKEVQEQSHQNLAVKAKLLARWKEEQFRFVAFTPYSSNILDMERELDRMGYLDKFYPDVVVSDYVGARCPVDPRMAERDHFTYEVKNTKRVCTDRNLLWFDAIQTNRGAMGKQRIDMGDIGEDFRMLQHCDKALGINQTEDEKTMGVLRIGKIAERHMESNYNNFCTVLQKRDHGRIFMESQFGQVLTMEQKGNMEKTKKNRN